MPQLIITPYSHIYISIVWILGISFLLFLKYFLPHIVTTSKINTRIALTNAKELLFQVFAIGQQPDSINNLCIGTLNIVSVTNILFIKIIFCFCAGYDLSDKICNYTTNNVFSYLQRDIY